MGVGVGSVLGAPAVAVAGHRSARTPSRARHGFVVEPGPGRLPEQGVVPGMQLLGFGSFAPGGSGSGGWWCAGEKAVWPAGLVQVVPVPSRAGRQPACLSW
jgi:hypothetical protein